jgi:radical SAM protein with 4Fe4S-binding SPASM domain
MRSLERWRYVSRSPCILWKVLAQGRYDFTFDLMPMRAEGMSGRKRLNVLASGLNLAYRRPVPWSWPIRLHVELTNFCNLRCPICPTGTGKLTRPPRIFDLGMYEDLMREVGPYLLSVTLWAWGEPLLHPQFPETVAIARQHGVLPLLSTNGQVLAHERVIQGLIEEPPTYLIVAIDGLTDETYSLNRPGARLGPAIEGVRRIAALKRERNQQLPVLHMRYIVTKHNQHEVDRIRDFATEKEFDFVSIRSLVIIDSDDSDHRARVPDSERFRAYQYEGGRRVRREDYVCQHAFLYPAVLADGTVTPCDQDYNARHAYGRIGADGSFGDIWFGRKAAELRRTIRTARERFSCCRNCPFADRAARSASIQAFDLRSGRAH